MPALPEFNDRHIVPAAAIDSFAANGHALVRGLASAAEVAAWRPLLGAAALEHRFDKRPLAERETYGKAFIQATNLWQRDARLAPFTLAPRFAGVAAALLGVDAVRIYHDQALFKEPDGGYTPWHQDQTYWPLATDRTITLWMPLVDVPAKVGTMHFVSGSHRRGDLDVAGISDRTQAHFQGLIEEHGWPVHTYGALHAGDATFHGGWTLHSAAANPTRLLREVMTIIYFADGTRVAPLRHKAQGHDLRAWLPGCAPGDLAATPLNPRLGPP